MQVYERPLSWPDNRAFSVTTRCIIATQILCSFSYCLTARACPRSAIGLDLAVGLWFEMRMQFCSSPWPDEPNTFPACDWTGH